MLWRFFSILMTFAIGRLTETGLPIRESLTRALRTTGRKIASAYISFAILKIGLIALLADLLLASNLRGGGELRVSQFSAVAVLLLIIGFFGLYVAPKSGKEQMVDQQRTDPLNEILIELLRASRAFIHEMEIESEKRASAARTSAATDAKNFATPAVEAKI